MKDLPADKFEALYHRVDERLFCFSDVIGFGPAFGVALVDTLVAIAADIVLSLVIEDLATDGTVGNIPEKVDPGIAVGVVIWSVSLLVGK